MSEWDELTRAMPNIDKKQHWPILSTKILKKNFHQDKFGKSSNNTMSLNSSSDANNNNVVWKIWYQHLWIFEIKKWSLHFHNWKYLQISQKIFSFGLCNLVGMENYLGQSNQKIVQVITRSAIFSWMRARAFVCVW